VREREREREKERERKRNIDAMSKSTKLSVLSVLPLCMALSGDPRVFETKVPVERMQSSGRYNLRGSTGKEIVPISLGTRICELICAEFNDELIEAVCDYNDAGEIDLSDLLHMSNFSADQEAQEDPEIKNDPLYGVDMLQALPNTLRKLGGAKLQAIASEMTENGREMLKTAMNYDPKQQQNKK